MSWLETVTLAEDPAFLLRMIRAYLRQGLVSPEGRQREVRARAEARVRSAPAGRAARSSGCWATPAKRLRDRENLRFERTRVFVARRLFVALGHHLAAAGVLAEARDVFYLTKEEIFGHLDGTAVTADLGALARLRRAEFAAYASEPSPPDRFETTRPRWRRLSSLRA